MNYYIFACEKKQTEKGLSSTLAALKDYKKVYKLVQ